jgi:hypothetical protein
MQGEQTPGVPLAGLAVKIMRDLSIEKPGVSMSASVQPTREAASNSSAWRRRRLGRSSLAT